MTLDELLALREACRITRTIRTTLVPGIGKGLRFTDAAIAVDKEIRHALMDGAKLRYTTSARELADYLADNPMPQHIGPYR